MKHTGNTDPGQSKPQESRQNQPAHRGKRPSHAYHRIKCNVCSHPDRAAIEEAFLRWESPEKLALRFGLKNHTSIYRHVHATGLYATHRRALSSSLEFILEHAGNMVPAANEFIRAKKDYGQLGDQGERIVPSKPRIIQCAPASGPAAASPDDQINRNIEELESDATH
jgi:hypothetical protein